MGLLGLLGSFTNLKRNNDGLSSVGNWVKGIWNDFTGQSAVQAQNDAQLRLAQYQAQVNEDYYNKYSSPQALMRQFKEAGLNPNLVYGSASGGQSNVPSFTAPQVQRGVNGSDRLNKALSVMSAVQGVMQGQYMTAAAREAAEQSAIKTFDDRIKALKNKLNFNIESDIAGLFPSLGYRPLFRGSSQGRLKSFVSSLLGNEDSLYSRYIRAARESRFNEYARPALLNVYDFGGRVNPDGSIYTNSSYNPYYYYRNQNAKLRFDLDSELRKLGAYGKLGIAAANLLFGK